MRIFLLAFLFGSAIAALPLSAQAEDVPLWVPSAAQNSPTDTPAGGGNGGDDEDVTTGFKANASDCLPGIPCLSRHDDEDDRDIKKAKSGSPTCDADFMNQIQARAFLEAEREITLSAMVIRKPDSVLELSCFDVRLGELANMFSSAKGGLEGIVLPSLKTYIANNFGHSFLGGSDSLDYQMANSLSQVSATCDLMNNIHIASKCTNFAEDDPFFDFRSLSTFTPDPRIFPENMQCGGTGVTPELLAVANNKDLKYARFDAVEVGLLDADECGDPIPSGLTYTYRETTKQGNADAVVDYEEEREEMTCQNPACYYDAKEQACIKGE